MEDVINYQKNQIIDNLRSLLEIKYVYESMVKIEGTSKTLLVVILKGNCSSLTQELSSMVAKIFQEQTNYLYRIFSFVYAEKQLREGNLFFVNGCTWGKMIFKNADKEIDVFHRYSPEENILINTSSSFQHELKKMHVFMEGATFFLEKENYPHAAFMLHQNIELWFRTVELFIMGKERKCHSIKEHQTYIKLYVPELGSLFKTEIEEELSLLRLLDEAYITTRYQNNYHINIVQIQKIKEKANRMFTIVTKLFESKLAECRKYSEKREPTKKAPFFKEGTSKVGRLESVEMNTLDKIRELAKEHFHTIKRNPSNKELCSVKLITEGYLETSFMISNLLKVCITALEADYSSNRVVPELEHNIREVLGYVLNLIPYDEMEFLDKIRRIIPDIETQCQP